MDDSRSSLLLDVRVLACCWLPRVIACCWLHLLLSMAFLTTHSGLHTNWCVLHPFLYWPPGLPAVATLGDLCLAADRCLVAVSPFLFYLLRMSHVFSTALNTTGVCDMRCATACWQDRVLISSPACGLRGCILPPRTMALVDSYFLSLPSDISFFVGR